MNEELMHDKRTKQTVKEILYKYLYDPVEKRYNTWLRQIIISNCVLTKSAHESFIYKGEYYCTTTEIPPRKMNRLHLSLVREMEEYIAELKVLNTTETPYVVGFITQILNLSNDFQDYLKVFPNVLHPPLERYMNTCPCQQHRLSTETIEQLKLQNEKQISMIKERLFTNLII